MDFLDLWLIFETIRSKPFKSFIIAVLVLLICLYIIQTPYRIMYGDKVCVLLKTYDSMEDMTVYTTEEVYKKFLYGGDLIYLKGLKWYTVRQEDIQYAVRVYNKYE